MFLVEDKHRGVKYLIFTYGDPRKDGCTAKVIEDVELDYDMEAVHRWQEGEPAPQDCIGRDKNDPKKYKVFKYRSDRRVAEHLPVAGTPLVFGSWRDYRSLNPKLEDLSEQEWYARLDEIDEAARRRQKQPSRDAPRSNKREDVAAWLAQQHFLVDTGIREIWYLPTGSANDEIRLLELNDRLGSNAPIAAIDFGMNIEGLPFRLFVADITSEQLEEIKRDPTQLPPHWSLDKARMWRRGA